jgi:3,4-dihydroxy 2-butanone 4-phosphate synthase / GTP cyclohydrolase II
MNDFFLNEFKNGNPVIVYDEDREVEGDFFLLAESITPEKINFLMEKAKGMICVACDNVTFQRLKIPMMVEENENPHGTNFGTLVDATKKITTGVSAEDRAETIRILANPKSTPDQLVRPGHTAPLRAETDFEKRFGHTEAAVGLARKVGKSPAVVICEILNAEGKKASRVELNQLSKEYKIPLQTLKAVGVFLGKS